ncbi:hypothetical protein CHS0354_015981, partial [Potamilus streckersoni]
KERHFKGACEQIVLLNKKILALQKRYKKAKNDKMRPFQYNIQLRLAVVEGVRNMYYEYLYKTAEQIVELRQELFGDTVQIVTDTRANDISV